MAFVRRPNNESPFHLDTVVTNARQDKEEDTLSHKTDQDKTFSDNQSVSSASGDEELKLRRSTRVRQAPARYGIPVNLDTVLDSTAAQSNEKGYHKVKKVLGQKGSGSQLEYLVQIKGEPSQQAFWVKPTRLDYKARKAVTERPPPVLL